MDHDCQWRLERRSTSAVQFDSNDRLVLFKALKFWLDSEVSSLKLSFLKHKYLLFEIKLLFQFSLLKISKIKFNNI